MTANPRDANSKVEIMELRRSALTESCLRSPEEDGLTRRIRPSNARDRSIAVKRRRRMMSIAGVLVLLGAGSAAVALFREELLRAAKTIGNLPPAQGGTAYASLIAVWLLLLLPTSLLEVLGGSIFGLWIGALCATIGKLTGSFISFAIGRNYKDPVQRHFLDDLTQQSVIPETAPEDDNSNSEEGSSSSDVTDDQPNYDDSSAGVSDENPMAIQQEESNRPRSRRSNGASKRPGKMSYVAGLKLAMRAKPFATCLALRLAYVPEAVQNYTPAVLDAPFPPFALATLLGSSAYAFLWANLGASLSNFDDVLRDGMSTEKAVFTAIGVASLFVVLGLVHWNTKRTIRKFVHLQEQQERHLASRRSARENGYRGVTVAPSDPTNANIG